jgi:hypothetical protein
MLSIPFFLYVIALLLTIASAVTPPRIPVWIPVLLVCVGLLVQTGTR